MNKAENCKYGLCIAPQAIKDNASWTGTEIDTKGWDFLEVIFILGATDIAMAALAVTQSDTTGSGHANVTGLIWGTSTNAFGSTSALPAATDDNLFQVAHVDLRGKKRFFNVTATAGDGTAGTYLAAIYRLSRGEVMPDSAAEYGVNELLRA